MTEPKPRCAAPGPAELNARFAGALTRLWPEGGKLGLAVSGGPDSLALLLLADAAFPGQFEVATVDHGLRPEAAGECEAVAAVCAERLIECAVLRVTICAGNIQARAREARYAALATWATSRGLSALATAHHADDQAETLLMRLNRASGHAGLGGVRERGVVPGSQLPLVRPLLGFRREELAQVVRDAGLLAVADPSNADTRFDRVRIRNALSGAEWLDATALSSSAAHLAEGDQALDWAAEREWRECVTADGDALCYLPRAPRAIALRVAARAVSALGRDARGQDLARLFDRLEAGRGETSPGYW